MNANYIIDRLKSTPFKFPTVALLQQRLRNLDEELKNDILSNLKKQIHKERNMDIKEPLSVLVYRLPMAS